MIEAIVIELRGDPRGKGRPRFRAFTTKAGRSFASAYTDSATRKYEDALRYAAQKVMGSRAPIDGPIEVIVHADFPVPSSWSQRKRDAALRGEIRPTTKPDWENIAKTLDALNQVVFVDDKNVVDGRVIKAYSAKPALRIEVRPLRTAAQASLLEAAE